MEGKRENFDQSIPLPSVTDPYHPWDHSTSLPFSLLDLPDSPGLLLFLLETKVRPDCDVLTSGVHHLTAHNGRFCHFHPRDVLVTNLTTRLHLTGPLVLTLFLVFKRFPLS